MGHRSAQAETLQQAQRFAEARAAYEQALGETPDDARVLGNYGGLLNELCLFEEAEAACLRAVAIDPRCWGAWSNLGNTMVERQRFADAVAAFSNCLAVNPGHAPALANLGVALQSMGQPASAVRLLRLAAEIEPENAETQCNLALALLASGDYAAGFAAYEWRWRTRAMAPAVMPMRRWQGEDFAGRTRLLHEEGGFGDTLQFVRFAQAAKARGGRVVLLARRELASLLRRVRGLDAVVCAGDPLPAADVHCPLLSLPAVLGTTIGTIPAAPYLTADAALAAAWRERLDGWAAARGLSGPRIGLVWAGSPRRGWRGAALADRRRSTTLATLGPLASCAGAAFVSLQVGEAAAQAAEPPSGMALFDASSWLTDFEQTAALASVLDLVIAVDTSTAHLAGALGRPVWMLSRFDQCWRWLAERDDTPWYPTMRLFRREAPHEWAAPVGRMVERLRQEPNRGGWWHAA
jgi:Tfp pilus assembly protein PilF